MKTLNLIQYISQHPEYETIVIMDEDDMEPMQAIYYLAGLPTIDIESINWNINGTLEAGTLLVYKS